jgi:hypothetical protein
MYFAGELAMKLALGLFVFTLCSSLITTAQVLPTSSGSCGVSASGLMSCSWLSAVPIRKADANIGQQNVPSGGPELLVTRFNLAPRAPLTRLVKGDDELIIGMGKGELVNEAKSPPLHISVDVGSVAFLPKEEPYAFRNVGNEEVDVLVVRMHTVDPAGQ